MGQGRSKEVFVAEDEALIRLDLAELLTEGSLEVAGQAADGEETVKLARELEPDLIIMDAEMSGMDGITAAETIGEERIAPILTLAALSQSELIERARDADVMRYLVKPFGASEATPAIEVVTGRFAELQAVEEELTNLEGRFESWRIIGQARGILQEGLGLIEPEASRWIQGTVMDLCKPVREVTEGVISHKRKK